MRNPRIYEPQPLSQGQTLALSEDGANHVGRVLRMQPGQELRLFNGDGNDYHAIITEAGKRQVQVTITGAEALANESPLRIHLGQVISRGDRMEFVIQKAVELGVSEITPLFSERCGVKLQGERLDKKVGQWQKVAISACEQCGRATVPVINEVAMLSDWVAAPFDGHSLTLSPYAKGGIASLAKAGGARLLIGPEGGFSDDEVALARQAGFTDVLLGPRVLRTETAALAAISALQLTLGDLG
ncbi:MAG: 16S rRNA (uracil(1498)-N(3))-methyltransferase [Pseudomonadota bacterium]|uniref:16S rRNA (uracil(1498)-N(3))-methyltransferase n=1 Tax=Gallaecimonas pentaromativorans TaxID=584787 RepID=UPI00067F557D|nr:16S rRNA (uracil(1498)-N(3))-methyltransferase [Gallaecimonas pentaromativorans]MED5523480.1 16S rRNA (uracil(1498)-N(3))-methyltransferase [Pseudomonadota bacterium]